VTAPSNDTYRRLAVSCLVGNCEALVASGDLNPSQEASLRVLIAHTLAAFEMPSKAERAEDRAA
jgi:hypothetical protein